MVKGEVIQWYNKMLITIISGVRDIIAIIKIIVLHIVSHLTDVIIIGIVDVSFRGNIGIVVLVIYEILLMFRVFLMKIVIC